jgi:UDP-3-O-[3-hydroxymyristoyl] glucosamine N-acyltransferase
MLGKIEPTPLSNIVPLVGECTVIGSAHCTIERLAPLSDAGPGALTFSRKLEFSSKASAVIVPLECAIEGPTLLRVENPRLAFVRVAQHFFGRQPVHGVHPTAIVDPSAKVDPSAEIGPNVVIGANCEVGAHSIIHANVVLYAGSRLGQRVVVHSGTVIGVDGFGFERDATREPQKFMHLGGVVIEDDVEIQANCCVARGALGDTRIGRGSKLDCLVHVAHNCQVGKRNLLTAQTMLAGSVVSGDDVWFSPGCRILNNTRIGSNAVIGMGAVVMTEVPEGATVVASPARAPMGKKSH